MKHRRAELEKLTKETQSLYGKLDTIEHYVKATKAKTNEICITLAQELKSYDETYGRYTMSLHIVNALLIPVLYLHPYQCRIYIYLLLSSKLGNWI